MTAVAFFVAAAIGGALRFVIESRWQPIGPRAFPRATLGVNVVGSFILGLTMWAPTDVRLIFGTALCGALTTFSGVSLQLHRRLTSRAFGDVALYVALLLSLGVFAAYLGMVVSKAVFG